MFLRGEPIVWIGRVAQLRMYRLNKFRSLLQRNFRNLGIEWHRRMVNESGNNTDDLSEGGLGRCESTCSSNAPGKDAGGDDSDSNDEEDPKEDTEVETERTKTQRRV